ncbi:MAG: transposase, partial [Blautia sp.]|nr:transposase [Blautia sp.]
MTVEKLGNENDIRAKYDRDPDEWAREYVQKLNEKEKQENEEVILKFSPTKRLTKNYRYEYQIGYLFLQKLYHELKLDLTCR